MACCLALGFEGKFRLRAQPGESLAGLREELDAILARLRGPQPAELSPHWRGVEAAHRPLREVVPLWVVGTATLGLLALIYVALLLRLGAYADRLGPAVAGLPPQGEVQIVPAGAAAPRRPAPGGGPDPPARPEPQAPPQAPGRNRHLLHQRRQARPAPARRQRPELVHPVAEREPVPVRQRRARPGRDAAPRLYRRPARQAARPHPGGGPHRRPADPLAPLPVQPGPVRGARGGRAGRPRPAPAGGRPDHDPGEGR